MLRMCTYVYIRTFGHLYMHINSVTPNDTLGPWLMLNRLNRYPQFDVHLIYVRTYYRTHYSIPILEISLV